MQLRAQNESAPAKPTSDRAGRFAPGCDGAICFQRRAIARENSTGRSGAGKTPRSIKAPAERENTAEREERGERQTQAERKKRAGRSCRRRRSQLMVG